MKEKFGNPQPKKPKEGKPPKPREEKVKVCRNCNGYGTVEDWKECKVCEGTGEVYET